jgi:hypothetical protein
MRSDDIEPAAPEAGHAALVILELPLAAARASVIRLPETAIPSQTLPSQPAEHLMFDF